MYESICPTSLAKFSALAKGVLNRFSAWSGDIALAKGVLNRFPAWSGDIALAKGMPRFLLAKMPASFTGIAMTTQYQPPVPRSV